MKKIIVGYWAALATLECCNCMQHVHEEDHKLAVKMCMAKGGFEMKTAFLTGKLSEAGLDEAELAWKESGRTETLRRTQAKAKAPHDVGGGPARADGQDVAGRKDAPAMAGSSDDESDHDIEKLQAGPGDGADADLIDELDTARFWVSQAKTVDKQLESWNATAAGKRLVRDLGNTQSDTEGLLKEGLDCLTAVRRAQKAKGAGLAERRLLLRTLLKRLCGSDKIHLNGADVELDQQWMPALSDWNDALTLGAELVAETHAQTHQTRLDSVGGYKQKMRHAVGTVRGRIPLIRSDLTSVLTVQGGILTEYNRIVGESKKAVGEKVWTESVRAPKPRKTLGDVEALMAGPKDWPTARPWVETLENAGLYHPANLYVDMLSSACGVDDTPSEYDYRYNGWLHLKRTSAALNLVAALINTNKGGQLTLIALDLSGLRPMNMLEQRAAGAPQESARGEEDLETLADLLGQAPIDEGAKKGA